MTDTTLIDALVVAQARIAELERALADARSAAIWSPHHPYCKRVIEIADEAIKKGGE